MISHRPHQSSPPAAGMKPVAILRTHLHQCLGERPGTNEQLGRPGPLLPPGPSEWVPALPSAPIRCSGGLNQDTLLFPGDCLGHWCSDCGDVTLSLDSDGSDPRPHANGGNVAVTREKEIAPYLVCPSLLRTTECPCGEAFGAHSACPVLSRDRMGRCCVPATE